MALKLGRFCLCGVSKAAELTGIFNDLVNYPHVIHNRAMLIR
jgi:hypothetical protein